MDALQLGPFYFPIQVVLALLGVATVHGVADLYRRRGHPDAGPALWTMIASGLVAARAVFVLRHHDLYAASPLSALDIRDGGFDSTVGLIAACVIGAELTRRHGALRRPLLAATLLGCAVWMGGTLANQALAPTRVPMPEVQVRRLDGTEVPLHSFGGRPLVVNLWATWCPPCRREMPVLERAQRAHPQVGFVYVNQGESAQAVGHYLAEHGLRVSNVVIDPARQVAARTGAAGYPTTLFYDAAGTLRLRHVGELSDASLRDKLEQLSSYP